ncbi:MAG: helix-turn-helix domain-containing protein, partial [Victivallales bacterium]|nr:helix-turn-helix domain-containing protein [Victivallales bacterium]
MEIKRGILPAIIKAASDLLAPYCDGMKPTVLVEAIEAYKGEECVTVNKACEMLCVSRCKLYRLVKMGKLHLIKIGGTSRISTDEIKMLLTGIE